DWRLVFVSSLQLRAERAGQRCPPFFGLAARTRAGCGRRATSSIQPCGPRLQESRSPLLTHPEISPDLNLAGNKSDPCQLSTLNVTNHGGQMPDKKQDLIDQSLQDLNNDGVDRRGFLKCMAWAGTGLVWTMSGGVPVSRAFAKDYGKKADKGGDFSFVQISDSHIGFN